jgi:uncharacterized protein (UPF0335 family)
MWHIEKYAKKREEKKNLNTKTKELFDDASRDVYDAAT